MTKITIMIVCRASVALLVLAPVAACAKPADQTNSSAKAEAGTSSAGMTLQVFQTRQEKRMLAADTDGDGKVSRAEFVAAAKAGKGDPAKRFARIDANGDGMLDKSEIDTMLARRFKKLDTNGDGVVSAEEREAARGNKRKAKADGSDS